MLRALKKRLTQCEAAGGTGPPDLYLGVQQLVAEGDAENGGTDWRRSEAARLAPVLERAARVAAKRQDALKRLADAPRLKLPARPGGIKLPPNLAVEPLQTPTGSHLAPTWSSEPSLTSRTTTPMTSVRASARGSKVPSTLRASTPLQALALDRRPTTAAEGVFRVSSGSDLSPHPRGQPTSSASAPALLSLRQQIRAQQPRRSSPTKLGGGAAIRRPSAMYSTSPGGTPPSHQQLMQAGGWFGGPLTPSSAASPTAAPDASRAVTPASAAASPLAAASPSPVAAKGRGLHATFALVAAPDDGAAAAPPPPLPPRPQPAPHAPDTDERRLRRAEASLKEFASVRVPQQVALSSQLDDALHATTARIDVLLDAGAMGAWEVEQKQVEAAKRQQRLLMNRSVTLEARLSEAEAYNSQLMAAIDTLRRDALPHRRAAQQLSHEVIWLDEAQAALRSSTRRALDDREMILRQRRRAQRDEEAAAAAHADARAQLVAQAEKLDQINADAARAIDAAIAEAESSQKAKRRRESVERLQRASRLSYLRAQREGMEQAAARLERVVGVPLDFASAEAAPDAARAVIALFAERTEKLESARSWWALQAQQAAALDVELLDALRDEAVAIAEARRLGDEEARAEDGARRRRDADEKLEASAARRDGELEGVCGAVAHLARAVECKVDAALESDGCSAHTVTRWLAVLHERLDELRASPKGQEALSGRTKAAVRWTRRGSALRLAAKMGAKGGGGGGGGGLPALPAADEAPAGSPAGAPAAAASGGGGGGGGGGGVQRDPAQPFQRPRLPSMVNQDVQGGGVTPGLLAALGRSSHLDDDDDDDDDDSGRGGRKGPADKRAWQVRRARRDAELIGERARAGPGSRRGR